VCVGPALCGVEPLYLQLLCGRCCKSPIMPGACVLSAILLVIIVGRFLHIISAHLTGRYDRFFVNTQRVIREAMSHVLAPLESLELISRPPACCPPAHRGSASAQPPTSSGCRSGWCSGSGGTGPFPQRAGASVPPHIVRAPLGVYMTGGDNLRRLVVATISPAAAS